MKNKNNLIKIFIIFIISLFSFNQINADDIIIDAKEVEIKDGGNIILASESVIISDGDKINISGSNVKYNKVTQIVEIDGNVLFIDKERNYKASSDKIVLDRNNDTLSTFGNTIFNFLDKNNEKIIFRIKGDNSGLNNKNKIFEINQKVELNNYENNYTVYSNKIIYFQNEELFKSYGDTQIDYKNNLKINTRDISLNKKNGNFFSEQKTLIKDNFENTFNLSSFNFNFKDNIFKAEKIKLLDKDNNQLELNNGYVDLNSNELIGSDFNLNFNKETFGNVENDPRLIGRYILVNQSEKTMKKSKFTTCKNKSGKCPAWSISANEVKHKKDKKRIEYKRAWLEIYDVPVAYFPYFFHPDPTVERQSGFLFPVFINSSNLGFSTQIPYYKAIGNDKDMTISPRIYTNNNLFIQNEYRQAFEKSNLISDFSFNNKDNSSSSHFFSLYESYENDSFYKIKIETVSNENYLKKYQIKSPLIDNYGVLNSYLLFEKNTEDYYFSSSASAIEDLSKVSNDKYEYIIPNYDFSKETYLNESFFDTFTFTSSGNYRKFNTNVDEMDVTNDFKFTTNNIYEFDNLDSEFNLLFRNLNTYGDSSTIFKDEEDYKIFGTALMNLKYPLIKSNSSNKNFLSPIASIRYSPTSGSNLKNQKKQINFDDLFKLDRVSNKTVEKGFSTTLGLEYKKFNNSNEENLNFGLGVNFRNKEDDDLPTSSSLGNKTSDIIGYSGMNITENLSFNYNFSIDQNLSDTNYSLVSMNYVSNKFKTSFEYMEKSGFIGDESYLNNFTEFELNRTNSLAFETNKNIDQNLTNYYNLIYSYKNDCLTASVVYNKQFYKDDDINPGQNIFFKLSLLPFGTINTPNLND